MLYSAVLCLGACGCIPVTLSSEPAVDFVRFRSVQVLPVEGSYSWTTRYLVDELRRASGFAQVTDVETEATALVLDVALSVRAEVRTDESGDEITTYTADAAFFATSLTGELIVDGRTSDSDMNEFEAIEDALDQVAHFFLRPYRT